MLKIGRHEHHILASLVANREKEGIPVSDEEASALIGFSPVTINNLRQQRAFQALVLHYAGASGPPPAPEPNSRMQALGLSALEELQERLAEDPEGWTKRELLDMAELLLVKANNMKEQRMPATTLGGGVRVAIQFVESKHAQAELEAPMDQRPAVVIEAEAAHGDPVTTDPAAHGNLAGVVAGHAD